ncbi:hypothetical protein [Streptomyces sp. CB03238]|uniref:hypothetical protein n=1 Tax=Streptomyces sp. CB03238 TaxID=1907777 RepID=UPI00117C2468|nr:hypothetical protein [Streptomyces sp. CB03238]
MADRTDGSQEAVTAAETAYEAATRDLHRQEVAAQLRSRDGLHYASIGDERTGPNLVAHNGEIVGETYTTSPGVLHDWYAVPMSGREQGPFVSARAAAASLIKSTQQPS